MLASARRAAIFLVLFLPLSCSTTHYRESADRETYGIIKDKTPAVPGMAKDFTIETEGMAGALEELLKGLPRHELPEEFLGPDGGGEHGAAVLSLEQALRIAVQNSRAYQSRKESLYLEFLGLTLERHNYSPIFSSSASGTIAGDARTVTGPSAFTQSMGSAVGIIGQIENLTGTPAQLLRDYADVVNEAGGVAGWDGPDVQIEHERSISGQTRIGVDQLMKGGGRIALSLASNFLRFMTGDPRVAADSALTASITQPLLRGAGAKVAAERLTQAERDALYALREFTRFRMQFTVDIVSDYYGVLEAREVARNNWQSYSNFQKSLDRMRAFYEESRETKAALGRLEQAQLSTENSWTNSVRSYRQNLDRFKVRLGLSADAPIMLDPAELDTLRQRGLQHPNITPEDAVKVAIEARLDLYNERDRVDDAERKVVVAANALKPRLDLAGGLQVPNSGQDPVLGLDIERASWDAGLDLDLPLDQKAERNSYRATLIANEQAKRNLSLSEDTVKLEVREAWRNLDQARTTFHIAQKGVELNQRRVEEQDLLAELGRATALNLVDAQNDLTSSQNELVSALVNHTIARIAFWLDMGVLYIKDNGQWEEVKDDRSS